MTPILFDSPAVSPRTKTEPRSNLGSGILTHKVPVRDFATYQPDNRVYRAWWRRIDWWHLAGLILCLASSALTIWGLYLVFRWLN